jgi:hypothetical protein
MKELGSLIKVLRSATENDTAEVIGLVRPKLASIAARLERHNKIEESQIYSLISELGKMDAGRLGAEIEKELNNLPHRFTVK